MNSLQTQALSLLGDASQLCAKLLELIKSKSRENSDDVDTLVAFEHTLKYQSMKGGIENVKQRLRTIKSLLTEKQNEEETRQSAGGCLQGQEKLSGVSKKDRTINQIEQDYQESAKELTALRCMLKTVGDERDVSWQESKQLRRTVNGLQNEVTSLKQEITTLNEDIQLKESEILLREGEISILRGSIGMPYDIICSPLSVKQFVME